MNLSPSRRTVCAGILVATASVTLALTGGLSAQAAEGQIVQSAGQAVPGSYIVVLKDQGAASSLAARHDARVTATYSNVLTGFAAQMTETQAKRLAADPAVSYVEQDGVVHATGTQANPTWGLDRIDQAKLPLDKKYTYPNEGAGATVYVGDTGIDLKHTEFGGRAKSGYDFIDNDADASDCQGHGTHVAGTVGSATYGVAKKVNLVAVRILDCNGSGQYSQVIAGIDWVAKNAKKPAVLTMSLGGPADTGVDTAVRNAVKAGVTVSVAAGNSNTNAGSTSPARVAEAITVGATASNDVRSSFSNYGPVVDIFAPGTSILSTKNGGGTTTMSGTSMATPHVAGAAAIYLSSHPAATPQQVRDALVNAASPAVTSPGASTTNKLLNVTGLG